MKVVATKLGYYDLKRRYPGDTFDIKAEKEFSKSWMKKFGAKEESSEDVDGEDSPSENKSPKAAKAVGGKGSKEGKSSADKAKLEGQVSSGDASVI